MRYSLIELVQRILESMDSDEVDDISSTTESLAVANIVKECYYDIISNLDLPEKVDIFQLDGSGDSDLPCVMYLPETALDLDQLKYNSATVSNPSWYDVKFIPFDQFVKMQSGLDADNDSSIGTQSITENSQTYTFKFKNDVLPGFYTSFNDRTLLFDAYDSSVNTTLVGSKTLCYGAIEATFTLDNDYVPDLDARQFQLLLQKAKAQAFVELKQTSNPKADAGERRNSITAQRTKHAIDRRGGRLTYLNYGRK